MDFSIDFNAASKDILRKVDHYDKKRKSAMDSKNP